MLIKNKELNNMTDTQKLIVQKTNQIEIYKSLLNKFGKVDSWQEKIVELEKELNQLQGGK